MKEGWEYKTLKELSFISGDYGLSVPSKPYDGIRYLRITDITDWGDLNNDIVSANIKGEIKKEKLEDGDILFARTGATVGKTLVYKKEFGDCLYAGYLIRYRLKKNLVLPSFIYYFTHSKKYYDWVQINQEAAAQPNISAKKYNSLIVPYPPLSEQQTIVDYLDSAFAKIDAMKANAEKALNEAKALFQASLKEMLEPKEGWVEKTLGEVCSSITDGTHHSPPNGKSGKYKYITAKNIRTWGLDLSNITYVSEDIHKEIIARCNPQKGDVLYIKDGATTGIAIVNPLEEEFSMLSSVALIKPHVDVLSSEFLCYSLNSPLIYNQMRKQMDGAAITRVTLIKIKNFVVSIPPLPKQQQIVSSLDSLKSKVNRIQENFDKISQECDALKQALLRQVFE